MSFFEPRDPDTPELITYVIDRSLHREATLTKTKLVKLLYLIDVEQWRAERRQLTSLEWIFFHYGPYAFAVEPTLNRLEGQQVQWKELGAEKFEKTIIYTKVFGASSGDRWPATTKMRVDRVVDRWADEPLELLLDFVYFHTEPMKGASRGLPLDFTRIAQPSFERPPAKPAVNAEIRATLRQLYAARVAERAEAATQPSRIPRFDEVWREAMEVEARIDGEGLGEFAGAGLWFAEEAAAAFGAAADE